MWLWLPGEELFFGKILEIAHNWMSIDQRESWSRNINQSVQTWIISQTLRLLENQRLLGIWFLIPRPVQDTVAPQNAKFEGCGTSQCGINKTTPKWPVNGAARSMSKPLGSRNTFQTVALFSSIPNWISVPKWCLEFSLNFNFGNMQRNRSLWDEKVPESSQFQTFVSFSHSLHVLFFFLSSFLSVDIGSNIFSHGALSELFETKEFSQIISKPASCAREFFWLCSVKNP